MVAPIEKKLPLLALTGGIGSGKSTVAGLFREHGAVVVSADQVARELLAPRASGWLRLRDEFADRFLDGAGRVDRAALRRAIFADPGLRARVNALLHPLIRARIAEVVASVGKIRQPVAIKSPVFHGVVVEVPLLFEVGWQDDFDCVVVVRSEDEQSIARLMRRDLVSRAEAEAAQAAQLPLAEKLARADAVIDNCGDLGATAGQVAELIGKLAAGAGCRRSGPAQAASPSS